MSDLQSLKKVCVYDCVYVILILRKTIFDNKDCFNLTQNKSEYCVKFGSESGVLKRFFEPYELYARIDGSLSNPKNMKKIRMSK